MTVWPLFDEQGTIRDLYDGTTIGQSNTFDEFGQRMSSTTTNPALSGFGTYYAGHELDAATGLYDMRARWYDVSVRRRTGAEFLQRRCGRAI